MVSLEGQRVVVIGGSSGIGLASAMVLAHAGARLVIVGRSEKKLVAAKTHFEADMESLSLDFSREGSVKIFFANLGKFDHLVLTADGFPAWGALKDIDTAALRKDFDNKFWGYFHCAKYALPHIREDGSITFVTGAASRKAIPGTAGLAAVNGAIVSMATTLAVEIAPIRVNAISPGLIDTPAYDLMEPAQKAAMFGHFSQSAPVKRIGKPEDIAGAILFVISNSFVTGTVIDVDGGIRL
ncbi:MAG: SDR family oxidoreductase [Nitrospirae bacterium]|nr:SDR family oxidoreductase [Nitrospirota bacterium]